MLASSLPLWRRFWLLPVFLLGVVWITAGSKGNAVTAEPAAHKIFMPFIDESRPVQLGLVPFTFGFENKTITAIKHAGDERLFIAGREGKIWIVNPDGSINPEPFLDISKQVAYGSNFEQGLLGLAFHPQYPQVPYFYVAYTTPRHIQIARLSVDPTNYNLADPSSLRTFMSIEKPEASGGASPVHNAGDLAFGPDGYLYIPLGDGGPDPYDPKGVPGDPFNNSQRRDTLLGSILRIDPDPTRGLPRDCGTSDLYSIPRDNPFLNDSGCDEIWATGLRNPWRMSIDPLNGDFYIADVGEWLREEVNYYPSTAPGGANFGWHCWEGDIDYTTIHPEVANTCRPETTYVFPVHQYDHANGRCSIIGGKIYRGQKYPGLYGRYIFGDWCNGELWTLYRDNEQWRTEFAGKHLVAYSTFGEDVHGELYVGGYANGHLYKVILR